MAHKPTKLPGRRKRDPQLFLNEEWTDRKLNSYHDGAVVVGDFFEQATSDLLMSERYQTVNSADMCPDVKEPTRSEFFVESKAMGLTGGRRFAISKDQMDNYDDYIDNYFPDMTMADPDWEPSMLYAFWTYRFEKRVKVGDFKFTRDLRKELAKSVVSLYLVDFQTLKGIVSDRPIKSYNMYPDFYSLLKSDFALLETDWLQFLKNNNIEQNGHAFHSTQIKSLEVYELGINPFHVYSLLDHKAMSKQSLLEFFSNLQV